MQIHIVQTGVANLASVCAAFRQIGCEPLTTASADAIADAPFLVLPGVGSFGAGISALREFGLVSPLRARIANGRPTLGICLGMQLLCSESEEAPGERGVGAVDGAVRRLQAETVPQMGWNAVEGSPEFPIPSGHAYFANSFALTTIPNGWAAMTATHGQDMVAALSRGPVLLCQFHPELSGDWGLNLLRQWTGRTAAPQRVSAKGEALTSRVIPCLDVRDGRVVKGVQFQGLRDLGDPVELAQRYAEQGADELVVLDIAATPKAKSHRLEVLENIRRVLAIPLTAGGGVRTVKDAAAMLEAGADKVAVNSAAVADPSLIRRLSEAFGRQCVVLAIDAQQCDDGWRVLTRSGATNSGKDAVAWAREAEDLGAGEILLTSWDRDGTGKGYDLALVRAIRGAVQLPVVASGGGRTADHMHQALEAGASAVLAASVLHDRDTTIPLLKQDLRLRGQEIRP